MRRGYLAGTALVLLTGLACFLGPLAQGQAQEIIRGTKKVPAGPPASPHTPPPAEQGARPAAPPAETNQSYQQGLKFVEAGDYDKAIKAFQQALQGNPQSAEIYFSLAQAFDGQGNQDKAVKNLQAALRLKPDFTKARVSLGQIYNRQGLALLRQGEKAQAEALFRDAIAQDPKNDWAFNNLGVALAQQNRYPSAITALQQAVALNPNNTKAQFNLGIAHYTMGDKDGTVQQYAVLTLKDPAAADQFFRIIQNTRQVATPFRF
jgi:tetratricopeptide (TPR) repeat protein